ncbi:MAG: hypothetical protein ABMB14_35895, partial [Myxococcota bacterium]
MPRTMNERSRAVAHTTMAIGAAACLVGAGVCGPWFADHPMDRVLIQLVFYGGWACLVGAFVGGAVGAAVEEDACGELDMGTMASVGAILGTLAGGTIGTALTGLSLIGVPWAVPWGAAVAAEGLRLWLGRAWPYGLVRSTGLDARGRRIDPAGALLPDADQPLRMRDRVAILVAVGAGTMLALTLAMAGMMGTDLGHPVMMAPMMYG